MLTSTAKIADETPQAGDAEGALNSAVDWTGTNAEEADIRFPDPAMFHERFKEIEREMKELDDFAAGGDAERAERAQQTKKHIQEHEWHLNALRAHLEKYGLTSGLDPKSQEHNPVTILFGDPGVGKSTIGNGLLQTPAFKNGLSFGKGLTQAMDVREREAKEVVDLPGLSDPETRSQCAAENSKGLKYVAGRPCKFLFICTQEGGRVHADQRTTMKLIMDAAPEIRENYGIVVNKCHKDILKIKDDPYFKKSFLTVLLTGLPPTKYVYFHQYSDEWSGDQKVPKFSKNLQEFFDAIPSVRLTKGRVNDVMDKDFDQMWKDLLVSNENLKKLQEYAEKAKADADELQRLNEINATRNFILGLLVAPLFGLFCIPLVMTLLDWGHLGSFGKFEVPLPGGKSIQGQYIPLAYYGVYFAYLIYMTTKHLAMRPESLSNDFLIHGITFRPMCFHTNLKRWHIWLASLFTGGILDLVTLSSLMSGVVDWTVGVWGFTTCVALVLPCLYAASLLSFPAAALVKTVFEDSFQTVISISRVFNPKMLEIPITLIFSMAFAMLGLVDQVAQLNAWMKREDDVYWQMSA